MKKILIGFFFAMVVLGLTASVQAANLSDPIDGIFKSVAGDMLTIEVPSLKIKSPDSNDFANGDLSFMLNATTAYRNFHQLSEIKEGDPIRVDYIEENQSKSKRLRANIITKLDRDQATAVTSQSEYVETAPAVPVDAQTVTTTTTTVTTTDPAATTNTY